jgi:hypothetical protein
MNRHSRREVRGAKNFHHYQSKTGNTEKMGEAVEAGMKKERAEVFRKRTLTMIRVV